MRTDDADSDKRTAKKLGGITGKGFMPGQSGNPSGRPKRLPISDRYAAIAELPAPDYLLAALKLSEVERAAIKTYGDALALSQFRAAIKGKTEAAREIADRVEGKARHPIEISGPGGDPFELELIERLNRGRARVAQMSEPKGDPLTLLTTREERARGPAESPAAASCPDPLDPSQRKRLRRGPSIGCIV